MCDEIFDTKFCASKIKNLNKSQWLKLYECFNNILFYMKCNFRSTYEIKKIGIVKDDEIILQIDENTPRCIIDNILKKVENKLNYENKEINYWCDIKHKNNF